MCTRFQHLRRPLDNDHLALNIRLLVECTRARTTTTLPDVPDKVRHHAGVLDEFGERDQPQADTDDPYELTNFVITRRLVNWIDQIEKERV